MSDGAAAASRRRIALVTGATGGIGEAVARRLAADGFRVCVGGRRAERLACLAAEVGGAAVPFDVTDEGEVERARMAVERAGMAMERTRMTVERPLDVLVNAAGVFDLAPVTRTGAELLRRNLEVNLVGAVNVTRAFLAGMLAARSGLIVNVGSVAGWRAFPENGAYAASKFGLRGFHEVLLEELRGTGVRACLLEPGAVDTPVWDASDPDAEPHLPNRAQMLRPDDVARAAGFVARLPDSVSVPLLRIERA